MKTLKLRSGCFIRNPPPEPISSRIPSGPSENTGFYSCFGLLLWMETQVVGLTPYENFLFGMKAKETKRQYPHRLDKFLTLLGLQGTIQEKCTKIFEIEIDYLFITQD